MATNFNGQAPAPRRNPTPATLPLRDVTDESIADAYAAFILYCNPAVPSDTDSIDLKAVFRAPPKSDGKSFSIFILYQLICKLEAKEIKTWAELALELGVELPVLEKGQSPQKVQQYAVRLKRWMHAMHVDAFFEYLRGKSHVYWTQVPVASDLIPKERDGVPNEEDLALRALLPETRPKRGRKRAEEKETDPAGETNNAARRRRINSLQGIEHVQESWSRTPSTDDRIAAVQESRELLEARLEAWAASTETGNAFTEVALHRASVSEISVEQDHRHPDRRLTHPVYRHLTSRSPNIDPFTPQNAEVPDTAESTPRPRRKTGTVVSSAWRSSSAAEGSKLRGRPPSNRNMSDGPYTTFSVIPEVRAGPTNESPLQICTEPPRPELWSSAVGNWSNTSRSVGGTGSLSGKLRLPLPLPDRPVGSPHYPMSPPMGSTNSPTSNAFNRLSPSNYSTQNNGPSPQHFVSQNNGPSPSSYSIQSNGPSPGYQQQSYPPQWNPPRYHQRSVETSIHQPRQSSITTSYYAADNSAPASASASNVSPVRNSSATNSSTAPSSHVPQQPRLTIESPSSQPEEDDTNDEAIEICYMLCILGASWEDNDGLPAPRPNADEALRLVKQLLKHMREKTKDDSSYLIKIAAMAGGRLLNKKMVLTRAEDNQRETIYKSRWTLKYGGIESAIQLECAVPKAGWDQETERADDEFCDPLDVDGLERNGEVNWKRKYEELHEFAIERSRKLRELKKTVLEGVLAAKDKI